jgi:regulator of protease activity HflC (stomatin/prohibitin superfamily)
MFRKTIKEYEIGVEWHDGKIVSLLKPGSYSFLRRLGRRADIFDTRQTTLRVPGQEIMLGDRTSLKVNVAGTYSVSDPVKLLKQINKEDLHEHVTQLVQLRLRDTLADKSLDDLLERKADANEELAANLGESFKEIGLTLMDIKIKDVILPSDLRLAYTESLSAQLRARAQLEKARGQSAALRNLANTADLIDRHPQLVQLLSLQQKDSMVNLTFEQKLPDSKQSK